MSKFNINTYFELIECKKIDEAIEYRASLVPEYIYKYVALSDDITTNNLKFSTLLNNQIWVSSIQCLNDPYEFSGMYINKEELQKKEMSADDINIVTSFIKSAFVASFSGNKVNNLPMWAHYANNHRGLCLKYKVNDKKSIKNIIYEPKRIDITKLFTCFIECAFAAENPTHKSNDIKSLELERDMYATIMQDIYLIKHNSWEYEDEYRIILPKVNLDNKSKGENVYSSDFGLQLTEVYCGINCSRDDLQKIISICESLNISCKLCKISSEEFTVFE